MSRVPSCFRGLTCLRALRTYVPVCLSVFASGLHCFKCFQFLTCFMWFHFFMKCEKKHNQPQQAGISKKWIEVVYTRNSLNRPKQLRTILENYFYPNIRMNIFLLHLIVKDFNIRRISRSRECSSISKGLMFSSALKVINIFRFKNEKTCRIWHTF